MAPVREIYRRLTGAARGRPVAAAVAMRRRSAGGVEYLLVRTSNGGRWTFPKGHCELGETLADAAAREAVEEAGAHGHVDREPFAYYRYGRQDVVAAFRLTVQREARPMEDHRDPTWFGLEAARSRLAAGHDRGFGEQMERVLLAAQQSDSGGFAVP